MIRYQAFDASFEFFALPLVKVVENLFQDTLMELNVIVNLLCKLLADDFVNQLLWDVLEGK